MIAETKLSISERQQVIGERLYYLANPEERAQNASWKMLGEYYYKDEHELVKEKWYRKAGLMIVLVGGTEKAEELLDFLEERDK